MKKNKNIKKEVLIKFIYKNKVFFTRLWQLIKIVIPSINSQEFMDLIYLSISLYLRSILSIYLATIKGRLVEGIVK